MSKPIRNDFYHGLLQQRTPVEHAVKSYDAFVTTDLEKICKQSGYFKTTKLNTYLAFKRVAVERPEKTRLKSCIFDSQNYFAKVKADFYVVQFTETADHKRDITSLLPTSFSEEFINSERYPLVTTPVLESKILYEIKDVELFDVPIYTRSVLCESTTAKNRTEYNTNFVYDEDKANDGEVDYPYICESDPGGGFIVSGRERVLVNQVQNRLGEVTIQASKEKAFASFAEVRFGCPVRDAYVLIRSKLDHDGRIYVSLPSVKCFARVGALFKAMCLSENQMARVLPRTAVESGLGKIKSVIDDIYADFDSLKVSEARAYVYDVISHSQKTRGKKKSVNPRDFITTTTSASCSAPSSCDNENNKTTSDKTNASASDNASENDNNDNVAASKNTTSHAFLNLSDYYDTEDGEILDQTGGKDKGNGNAFDKDRCCVVCDFLAFPDPFKTTEDQGGFPESRLKIPHQIVSLILKMARKKGDVCKDTHEAKRVETVSFLLGYLVKKCLIRIKSLETIPLDPNKITENTFAFCNKKIMSCLTGTGWEVQRNCAFVRTAVSQVVIKHNVVGAISHKTRIQQTVSNDRVKAPGLRTLKAGSFGFICPSETPEGTKVGLTFNLTNTCELTLGGGWLGEKAVLHDFLYEKLKNGLVFHPDKNQRRRIDVRLDGEYAGSCSDPHLLVSLLRRLRRECGWDSSAKFCPSFVVRNDDEVSIYTDVGRFCRPLVDAHFFYGKANRILSPTELGIAIYKHFAKKLPGFRKEYKDRCFQNPDPEDQNPKDPQDPLLAWQEGLREGSIVYRDHIESEYSNLALLADLLPFDSMGQEKEIPGGPWSLMVEGDAIDLVEVDPYLATTGALSSRIPFSNHSQSPKLTHQCSKGKQAAGVPSLLPTSWESNSHILAYPQKSLIPTGRDLCPDTHDLHLSNGSVAVIAICPYEGNNQEDSIVLKKQAVDRGQFDSIIQKTVLVEMGVVKDMSQDHKGPNIDLGLETHDSSIKREIKMGIIPIASGRNPDYDYSKVDPKTGVIVTDLSTISQGPGHLKMLRAKNAAGWRFSAFGCRSADKLSGSPSTRWPLETNKPYVIGGTVILARYMVTTYYREEDQDQEQEQEQNSYSTGSKRKNDATKNGSVPEKKRKTAGKQKTGGKVYRAWKRTYDDISVTTKDEGFVTRTHQYVDGSKMFLKIQLTHYRIPQVGDKFATTSAQKSVVSAIISEENLPFDIEDGTIPDALMNVACFPTRMTMGHFISMITEREKAGGHSRKNFVKNYLDGATSEPFSKNDLEVIDWIKKLFIDTPSANRKMVDGKTGALITNPICVGFTNYQKLKHMCIDKVHARGFLGARDSLTNQPLGGRNNLGGLKLGEMEFGALAAHGCTQFMREYSRYKSDSFPTKICCQTPIGNTSTCYYCGRDVAKRPTINMGVSTVRVFQFINTLRIKTTFTGN